MTPRLLGLVAAFCAPLALAGGACATSTADRFDPSAPSDGRTFGQDARYSPAPSGPGEVFGHSESALYRVDTLIRSVSEVGVFQGCTYVADIALDESSNIYASTGSELYYVETNTARCTRIASGTFPNSLSFVPAGTVEAAREALVGFQGGDYVKIDPQSGAVERLGEIGESLQSSGDLVSAKGGKTFAAPRHPRHRRHRRHGGPGRQRAREVLGRRLDHQRPHRPGPLSAKGYFPSARSSFCCSSMRSTRFST